MTFVRRLARVGLVVLCALAGSCRYESADGGGSQTNWLRRCDASGDCGGLECICGVCTAYCSEGTDCDAFPGGSCVGTGEPGAVAACDGLSPSAGTCLASCVEQACPAGASCVAGVCARSLEPTIVVSIEPTIRHQTLVGFGASLGYDEDHIVASPDKQHLFDVMFGESGLDVVRIRNRYEPGGTAALGAAAEIVTAATARLGHTPLVFLGSPTPPSSLKANGSRFCAEADVNCTLTRDAGGAFDYAGFAAHWRASLESYEERGIHPDFISIQSSPDWIPLGEANEACRFLPREGTGSVTTPDGEVLEAEFPGYAEALEAVEASVGTLPLDYSFSGPEVGGSVLRNGYIDASARFATLSYNLYGTDAENVPDEDLEGVRALAEGTARPTFQSAMAAGGLATAVLTHHALAVANSSGYLQDHFVAPTFDETSTALIGASDGSVETLPAYHALAHFARFTDPGWLRVEATVDSSGLLPTAWESPDGGALTIVLVNPTGGALDVEVRLPSGVALESTRVTRTVFNGVERSAELGVLSPDHVVRLPGQAIVTITASIP